MKLPIKRVPFGLNTKMVQDKISEMESDTKNEIQNLENENIKLKEKIEKETKTKYDLQSKLDSIEKIEGKISSVMLDSHMASIDQIQKAKDNAIKKEKNITDARDIVIKNADEAKDKIKKLINDTKEKFDK